MVDPEHIKWYLTLFLLLTGISLHSYSDIPTKLADVSPISYINEPEIIFDTHNYTPHDPILVIGDGNFTQNGFSGNGTWQFPYVIENLNITSLDGPAIQIINTTRPFAIRDCLIVTQNQDINYGLYFENVSNGNLEETDVSGFERGLYLKYSRNIQVYESDFFNCWVCIETWSIWNLSLFENTIVDCRGAAILEGISDSMIKNNTLTRTGFGICINAATTVCVESNTIVNGPDGIMYANSRDLYVRKNYFVNLSSVGILSSSSLNGYSPGSESILDIPIRIWVEYNVFENCSWAFVAIIGEVTMFSNNTILSSIVGVLIEEAHGNYIIDNEFLDSAEYGIYCNHAHYNTIYGNLIVNSGISNARDDDRGHNFWDNGEGIGNIWDDHIGLDVYQIPGTSRAKDHYPQRYGSPYISAINETEIVVGISGVNVTWSAFDSDPSIYTIYLDGTEILSEIWNGSSIYLSLEHYEVGTYNLTAIVTDEEGLTSSCTVIVRVIPNYALLIILTVGVGSVGLIIIVFFKNRLRFNFEFRPKGFISKQNDA